MLNKNSTNQRDDFFERLNVCRLDDFDGWWREHHNHNQTANNVGGQVLGVVGGHVKQSTQVASQLFAGWREFKIGRFCSVVIKVGPHKAPLHQRITMLPKLIFCVLFAHKRDIP